MSNARAWIERVLSALPHLYALRAPIVLGAALASLPFVAFCDRTRPLMSGLYDVAPRGMLAVTLVAFMAAWTLLHVSWLILAYGPRRLPCRPLVEGSYPIPRAWFFLAGALALPTWARATLYSRSESHQPLATLALWGAGGFLLSVVIVLLIGVVARAAHVDLRRRLAPVVRWAGRRPELSAGYVEGDAAGRYQLVQGHGLALLFLVTTVIVYVAIGWTKSELEFPSVVPTIAYALVLLMLLAWVVPALTFFFDRYRVPVLVPLVAIAFLSAWLPHSDHFYRTAAPEPHARPAPAAALAGGGRQKVIVVAADGGGIQATAWTARVLTGLEELCRREGCGGGFAPAVRLVSAVSGGSVAAMYFVNLYDGAGFTPAALQQIRADAEASSLHAVGWGIVYADLVRMHLPLERFRFTDRGSALERAWLRRDADKLSRPLSAWRAGIAEGRRPAVIFNATDADSGDRVLFSTSGVVARPGQRAFEALYPDSDVSISTAVRLSATFPYVTPAARAVGGGVRTEQPHLVDGGYYDSYGMASLLDWVNAALSDRAAAAGIRDVLIVQIRSSPSRPRSRGTGDDRSSRGWFYQSYAPLSAMLAVRRAGQAAHNAVELELLTARWKSACVTIRTAEFEYPGEDAPLSWHLTKNEQRAIERHWTATYRDPTGWPVVQAFLNTGASTCPASR